MELNSTYLNKSYYVATLLQYCDELKREGFAVHTRKKLYLGLEPVTVDLFAEKEGEKRLYEFRAEAATESAHAKLEELAASAGARLMTVYVRPPMDRRIVFEGLDEVLNTYFAGETLPEELDAVLPGAVFEGVCAHDLVCVSIEKDGITVEGSAVMTVRLPAGGEKREVPLWFYAALDADRNPASFEYETDVSGLAAEAKRAAVSADTVNKTYISKTRFESEFAILQELSEKVLTMLDSMQCLFNTSGGVSAQTALETCTAAEKAVNRYAAFIPAPLYELLEELMDACRERTELHRRLSMESEPKARSDLERAVEHSARTTRELKAKTTARMREYIAGLDVKE